MPDYDTSLTPAAPRVTASLGLPGLEDSFEFDLWLDTGAEVTVVPRSAIDYLEQYRELNYELLRIWGFDAAAPTLKKGYYVEIAVANLEAAFTKVITYDNYDDAVGLLGRDVINHYKTKLRGPAKTWSIKDPTRKRGKKT